MSVELWNLLHDGSLTKLSGQVPGRVELTVEIDYLREIFRPAGRGFVVTLTGCTRLEFQPWDAESAVTNFAELARLEPELLSADERDDLITVTCVDGVLRLVYSSASVRLDTGRGITLAELESAAQNYWDELESG